MNLKPSEKLTENQIQKGLNLLIKDGVMAEMMATLTGGAFLVSLALKFGASNFQIGLMASLPTLASLFQLISIYLVYKYANRKAITVYTGLISRTPLFLIGLLPLFLPPDIALVMLISFLFFHYFFGSISGSAWGSWIKDLVPEKGLGRYFSNRTRIIQILNVFLSYTVAHVLDYIRHNFPQEETLTYAIMFMLGGASGLIGLLILIYVPEPVMVPQKQDYIKLFKKPLNNLNYRNLLVFNAFWAFAVNLAAPFFTVYLLKMLKMNLSDVVTFSIISQLTNILFIRIWGKYSDKYSNKTIIQVCAPLYICCLLAWTFTTLPEKHNFTFPLLILIYLFSGVAMAGINLALNNIGIKMAPKGDAIVYLTTKNITNGLFAATAPLIGGFFADYFSKRELAWTVVWKDPEGITSFYTLDLQNWDFFFAIAVVVGLFALYRLSFVKEEGEVEERVVMTEMRAELLREMKAYSSIAGLRSMVYLPISFIMLIKEKVVRKKLKVDKNKEDTTESNEKLLKSK